MPNFDVPLTDPLLLAPAPGRFVVFLAVPGGTGLTTGLTYTVPAGRIFRLEYAAARVQPIAGAVAILNSTTGGRLLDLEMQNPPTNPPNQVLTFVSEYINSQSYWYAGESFQLQYASSGAASTILVVMIGTEFNIP